MFQFVKNSPAYFKANKLLKKVEVSEVPCSKVAVAVKKYLDFEGNASPEVEAGRFYLYNHAFAECVQGVDVDMPLSEVRANICWSYLGKGWEAYQRLAYYLLLICVAESRHAKKSPEFYDELEMKHGLAIRLFAKRIDGRSRKEARNLFLDNPVDATLGELLKSLSWVFYEGKFSGGYGGKAWGNISDTLQRTVEGVFTPEICTDTAFTLSHNNGSIFNKGVLYDTWGSDLATILDVQRSGQIPNLILGEDCPSCLEHLRDETKVLAEEFPHFKKYVDWFQVEALGSLKSYPSKKAKQHAKWGAPPGVKLEVTPSQNQVPMDSKPSNKIYLTEQMYVRPVTRV